MYNYTHAFIFTKKCGCTTAITLDDPTDYEGTESRIKAYTNIGYSSERVDIAKGMNKLVVCSHRTQKIR